MIAGHLPVLLVVLPLMAAPVCVVLRSPAWAWTVAALASWGAFAAAIGLLLRVLDGGPISYPIGGWAAPWGIEYRLDSAGAFVAVIVSAIGAIVVPYARASIEREVSADRIYLFYCMYLLCLAGLLGITATGDAFNLFVFLEISSLSSYVMIALAQDRRALTAAYRYLIMGTIGATFYLIGVGLMYMMTGTLNMADLALRLPAVAETRTILAALAFLTVGICLKLALFPLHLWLPNAYTYAPSVVSAFLAATATKVAVYVLIRVYFTIFANVDVFEAMYLREVLMGLAVFAMLSASAIAVFQTNIKRVLAYSSLAQIGYMVLGMSFATLTGLTGSIIHLFNHALMKGALFMAMGCVVFRLQVANLDTIEGLGRRMPATMGAFVVGGLSLIGVPLTVGFVSKWTLVLAAIEADMWTVVAAIVGSSVLAIAYVWRIVEASFFRPAPEGAPLVAEAPLSMLVPTWLLAAACVWFGIDARTTLSVARQSAAFLLGGGP